MHDVLYSRHTVSTPDGSTVHLGFTSRAAGNLGLHVGDSPAVAVEHRADLEEFLLGTNAAAGFIYLEQVHGTEVCDADQVASARHTSTGDEDAARQLRSAAPVADAAVTCDSRALAVMVADCIPLVFVGEHRATGSPILGVAHAGRRGLLDGVIEAAVQELLARSAENIRVWIGPSICGRCYEVPADMHRESSRLLPEVASTTSWGTPALDLPAGAHAVLQKLPAVAEVSDEFGACTLETEQLFSHRAVAGGREAGRIAGLVWVEKQ